MNKKIVRKILVTGAGGFIGSHLTEALLDKGDRITAFVRYTSTGSAGFLDNLEKSRRNKLNIVYGDIRDRDDVMRAARGNDIIIHLAAQIAIPYSYIAPADFIRVNVDGTLNVLMAARELKISRLVHMSTSEVYGSAQYVPIDENHPQVAQSPYAASKIAADKLVESFYRSYGVPAVIARPFNTYGPRQSPRAVVPTIILQALRGHTVRLGNVNSRRDLNYVDDTVKGLIKMAYSNRGTGRQFNLASGKDHSIAEIVDLVGDIIGRKLRIKTENRRVRPRKSEVDRLLGDGALANRLFRLGNRINLKDGLRHTVSYFESNIDRYHQEDYRK